jgi:hypothetical protein
MGIHALLAPWDGSLIIGNPSAHRSVTGRAENDKAVGEMLAAVIAVVAEAAGKTADKFVTLNISARDPALPVKASALFNTDQKIIENGRERTVRETYEIPDLFAACAKSAAMAQAYGAVLAWMQTKIGA